MQHLEDVAVGAFVVVKWHVVQDRGFRRVKTVVSGVEAACSRQETAYADSVSLR